MFQLKALPLQPSQIRAPLLLLIVAIFCFAVNNHISEYFIYNRALVIENQYWRFITGHLFHTNYAHLLLNTLAIVLLWALHGQFYSTKQYTLLFLFSSLLISIGIFVFTPEMNKYVGLSGVLHALFFWGALKDIQHKEKTGYVLCLGAIIKVAHEHMYGASEDISALINANVAIDAHLLGIISGLLFYLSGFIINTVKTNNIK